MQAQEKNPDLQRELTLEKEYSPNLGDANKLNRLPEIKEPEAPKTQVEFSNYTLDLVIPPSFQKLGVINYFPGFADSDQQGYLTAGFGTGWNIDIDAGYQILRSETDRLSLFASHRSSNSRVSYLQHDSIKGKMQFNDNAFGLDFRHRFEKAVLSADAQYTHSAFNYYGFPPPWQLFMYLEDEDAIPIEYTFSPNQVNNLLKAHLGVTSGESQDLDYRMNLTYTLLKHKQADVIEVEGKTENRILLDGGLYANINATSGIGMDAALKTYFYRLPADARYDPSFLKAMGNSNYVTFSVNPYLTLEGDTWDARLGVKGHVQFGGVKKFLPSPDIHLRWRPADPVLAYLTADGGIRDHSAYNTYYENRYVNPIYRVRDSRSPLDATLGIVLSPVNGWSVNVFHGYQWIRDEHFYLNEWCYYFPAKEPTRLSEVGQKMLPLYADAQLFKAGGSVKYQYQDLFDWSLKLQYNHWKITKNPEDANGSPTAERIAPNKPAFTGDWSMGYKLPALPLRFHLNYHLETGRKTLETSSTLIRMKNIHDVNVAATYTFNENLSVFAKANNLLFQTYDLWDSHPAQGFNVMAGVNLKF
jgi:hypothetical protein